MLSDYTYYTYAGTTTWIPYVPQSADTKTPWIDCTCLNEIQELESRPPMLPEPQKKLRYHNPVIDKPFSKQFNGRCFRVGGSKK